MEAFKESKNTLCEILFKDSTAKTVPVANVIRLTLDVILGKALTEEAQLTEEEARSVIPSILDIIAPRLTKIRAEDIKVILDNMKLVIPEEKKLLVAVSKVLKRRLRMRGSKMMLPMLEREIREGRLQVEDYLAKIESNQPQALTEYADWTEYAEQSSLVNQYEVLHDIARARVRESTRLLFGFRALRSLETKTIDLMTKSLPKTNASMSATKLFAELKAMIYGMLYAATEPPVWNVIVREPLYLMTCAIMNDNWLTEDEMRSLVPCLLDIIEARVEKIPVDEISGMLDGITTIEPPELPQNIKFLKWMLLKIYADVTAILETEIRRGHLEVEQYLDKYVENQAKVEQFSLHTAILETEIGEGSLDVEQYVDKYFEMLSLHKKNADDSFEPLEVICMDEEYKMLADLARARVREGTRLLVGFQALHNIKIKMADTNGSVDSPPV